MIQQSTYGANDSGHPAGGELPHEDFIAMLKCLKIFGGSVIVSGIVYLFVRNLTIAAGICGGMSVLLTLYHTPFGLFILFSLLSVENAFVLSPTFTISKLMGIIILISYLLHMRHLKVVNPTPQKLIFTLALWSCATLLWSIDLGRTGTALSTFLLYIGFCFIFLNTVRDKKSFFAVLSGFAVGAFITSSMLMAGYAAYETGSAAEMGRATLHEDVSPVILGRSIAFGFLAACCTFFWPGKLKKIITMGLLMLFFLAIATKTQSRTALAVALGVPVLSLILCSESKNRLKYFFFALLFGGIALFAVNQTLKSDLMTKRAKVRFQGQGLEESGRLRFWSLGFQAFLKRPIQGYGISNAPLALERLKGFSTHNNIVAISVELGLVGLVLFTAIFIVLYMQSRLISDVRLKWLGVAMLLFALICGMTSTNYTKKDFWYALAVAMVAFNIQSTYKTGNAEPLKLDKDASRVA